jgi:hypothetical protein
MVLGRMLPSRRDEFFLLRTVYSVALNLCLVFIMVNIYSYYSVTLAVNSSIARVDLPVGIISVYL